MKHAIMPIIIWLLNLFDCISTYIGVQRLGLDLEQNPIAKALLPNPVLFFVVKIGTLTLTCVLIYLTRKNKIVKISSWLLFAVYLYVAIENTIMLTTII